jgi:hypothetical protein
MRDKGAVEEKILDLLSKFTVDGQDWYLPIATKSALVKEKDDKKIVDDNRTYRVDWSKQNLRLPVESGQTVNMANIVHHSYNGIQVDRIAEMREMLTAHERQEFSESHGIPTEILKKILATIPEGEEPYIKKGIGTMLTGTMMEIMRQERVEKIDTDALHLSDKGAALTKGVGIKPRTGIQDTGELDWRKMREVTAKFNLSESAQKERMGEEETKIAEKKQQEIEAREKHWREWREQIEAQEALMEEQRRAEEQQKELRRQEALRPKKKNWKERLRGIFLGE